MTKNNNILILGNGFDLSIGLQSKFAHYISHVFQQENIKLSEILKFFNTYDKKKRLIELYNFLHYKQIDLPKFIENNWLIFLCFYEMSCWSDNLNWADVEQNLTKYIISLDFQDDIPINCLYEYYDRGHINTKIEPKKIIQHIDNFTHSFVEYIKTLINNDEIESNKYKTQNFKTKAWSELLKIFEKVSIDEWRNPNKNDTYILNFNYTNWFESFKDQNGLIFSNFVVNNIHGSIDQKSKCIIGIDDKKVNLSMNSMDLDRKRLTNQYIFSKTYKDYTTAIKTKTCRFHTIMKIKQILFFVVYHFRKMIKYTMKVYLINTISTIINKFIFILFFLKVMNFFQKFIACLKKYGESFDNKLQGNTLISQLSIEDRLKIIEFS